MTAEEFAAWRAELGVSPEDVARELDVKGGLVEKWEDGRIVIARRFEAALPFVSYAIRARALLAKSGLAVCPVASAFEVRDPTTETSEESSSAIRDYVEHGKRCPLCQARERYVVEHLGPMPKPPHLGPWYFRAFGAAAAKITQLPTWLQPPAWGAVILFALTAFRVLFGLPLDLLFHGVRAVPVGKIAMTPFIAALGGAAGGFGYTLFGKPLRRVPVAGAYLAGIVTAEAYLLSLWWVLSVLDPKSMRDSADSGVISIVMVAVGVIIGLMIGHTWFASDDADGAYDAARKVRRNTQLG